MRCPARSLLLAFLILAVSGPSHGVRPDDAVALAALHIQADLIHQGAAEDRRHRPVELRTWLTTPEGKTHGAYFASVERLVE